MVMVPRLETDKFMPLTSLKSLHIDRNGIIAVEKEYFDVLQKLSWLKCDSNICANFERKSIENGHLEVVPLIESYFNSQLKFRTIEIFKQSNTYLEVKISLLYLENLFYLLISMFELLSKSI